MDMIDKKPEIQKISWHYPCNIKKDQVTNFSFLFILQKYFQKYPFCFEVTPCITSKLEVLRTPTFLFTTLETVCFDSCKNANKNLARFLKLLHPYSNRLISNLYINHIQKFYTGVAADVQGVDYEGPGQEGRQDILAKTTSSYFSVIVVENVCLLLSYQLKK